ncbi:MAG TPA: MerR family transcriptional regulator [Thauera sp.]|uniref:MerR family transcriptional regulator n=1 Tax=Thauera sp. TaxID=1905334 RepID=UPI002BA1B430|nr:MerR family transcriptional regulator [Thauera sp.]HRP22987.1 MerR family transcriptional regulator [Thauera sp.]HRP66472.1 MerR family transcriptional regulator [Thauera sp.]
MNDAARFEAASSIAAVERDTGLPKDTLRVWERRYGFPAPARDANGERLYPPEQVEKLRLIRRLIDHGRRPAGIVGASTAELSRMLEDCLCPGDGAAAERDDSLLQLVRLHRSLELNAALRQALMKQGLQRFVADTVAPLAAAVGEAWMRGEVDVPEEHLFTEQVQNVLRSAISAHAVAGARPRVLLTTFPEEEHILGLLMAEAMLVPEGASCLSLGTRTPLADIRTAAVAGGFDIVGLSFSIAYPARQAIDGLLELRASLPPAVAIWAGGAAVRDKHKRLPGIRVVGDLDDTLAALREWRAAHA